MLTDTEIRKSKPTDKAYRLADSKGLFLFITPTGGKLWRFKYRHEGKQKLMALGQYPDVPLVLARERHAAARALLATGVDPMQVRKTEKVARKATSENSFRTIAGLWLEHWRVGKSGQHVDSTRRRIEANVFPLLGARPITEIEAPELVTMVKSIEGRGVGDLAKRALETTGQIFRFGIAHGYTKRNPAAEIKPSDILRPTKKTNLARVDVKELPALLRSIEVYQGTHVTRLSMKLLALTFVRTTELIGARWQEFDLEARRWNIPESRMKMRTPHIVPLSSQAIEVLELLRSLARSNEFLFPGDRNAEQPMSNNTILLALKRMGYQGRMTGHGFRGLASTILHEQGYAHEHIELQLAHAPRNAVSAAYNHALYLEPRAKMMQDWADFLERTQRGGKVLPFRGTAA
ncbi:MAG: tyrosine-type recombinase/integrase [Terracidiphilus sp.]|nr:tyrosine-type recombinase/integrase [Terracidiphilus sp.]